MKKYSIVYDPNEKEYYVTKKLFGIFNIGILGYVYGTVAFSEQDAFDKFNIIYNQSKKVNKRLIILKEFIIK